MVFFFFLPSIDIKAQNIKLADSLIFLYDENLPDSAKLEILREISFNHANPDVKLNYAKKLIELASKDQNFIYIYRGYLQAGYAYKLKGDLKEAANLYFKSLETAQEVGFQKGIGASYLALGDVFSVNNDFSNSVKYYNKAISIFSNSNDSINLASAFLNIGETYRKFGKPDSALNYFTKSKAIFQSLDYQIGIAINVGNIGLVYAIKNKPDLAEDHISRAIEILQDLGDYYSVSSFYTFLTDIYKSRNDLRRAFIYAELGLQISQEHGLKEQIRDASLKLSELYAQNKEYEKAYHHHTQYVAYRDSINNEEVTRKMADLRTEFEVSQKQSEIDLLTKQRQLNKLVGIGLVSFTVLLAALAFVLFRNNRIKQAANQLLSSQKQELEVQHHKLETLNHTKDRFFSIISHDLRGPVSAFNGLSGLIKHYIAGNEMGQLREVSEYIDKSARQLSGLLDNLLDWAIKQQGAFPFHPEKIYLNSVLQEIEEMFGITAHAKNIILSVNTEEEIILWADRNSFTTILRNLVNNALKFTEPEGLVTISAFTQKDYAHINIMDTGVGIPEEQLEKLFQVKDKVSSRGTSGEKGLGIGLSLAYEFTKMNKGSIMVNSEEKAGTIFTVKIPLYGSSKKSSPKSPEPAEENTMSR